MFIDKEKLDEEIRRFQTRMKLSRIRTYSVTIAAVLIIVICHLFEVKNGLLISVAVAFGGIVMLMLNMKLAMTKSESFGMISLVSELQRDYASDHIYAKAYTAMSEEHRPIKKQRLIMIAAEICGFMGNLPQALQFMNSVDTKVVAEQDEDLLMIYYHDLMYYYFTAEDMESVRRIYSDTLPLQEKYASNKAPRWDVLALMNFYRCIAEGDYAQALSQRLAINDYKNNSPIEFRNSALAAFMSAHVFYETALTYYYAGDRQSALASLDAAAPGFARDPYWLDRANRLAAQIQGTTNVQ